MRIVKTFLPNLVTIENSQDIKDLTSHMCNSNFAVYNTLPENCSYPFNAKFNYDLSIALANISLHNLGNWQTLNFTL